MAVTNTSKPTNKLLKLVARLQTNYPKLNFALGKMFVWSPAETTVYYRHKNDKTDCWSLLHELGHALLDHTTYEHDFGLLKLEVAAWSEAKKIAACYDIVIDQDHIEDCLDTYREWLHARSTCPSCLLNSLPVSATQYQCYNCRTSWRVSASRLTHVRRTIVKNV
jgi:cell division protein FtsL